jgi:signal transduction histidine kinase
MDRMPPISPPSFPGAPGTAAPGAGASPRQATSFVRRRIYTSLAIWWCAATLLASTQAFLQSVPGFSTYSLVVINASGELLWLLACLPASGTAILLSQRRFRWYHVAFVAAGAAVSLVLLGITPWITALLFPALEPFGAFTPMAVIGWAAPFWRVPLAHAAFALAIVYFVRARDAQTALLRVERSTAESSLRTLQAQLRPHFLFNTLNSISALLIIDPRRAAPALRSLRTLVDRLAETVPEVPLSEELQVVSDMVAIETLRLGRLTVEIDVPAHLRAATVPFLSVEILVENAIRHGIAPMGAAGVVAVRVRDEGRMLRIEVRDNGTGQGGSASAKGLGIGLRNVRQRLDLLYGSQAGLRILADPQGGTRAELVLPLHLARASQSDRGG